MDPLKSIEKVFNKNKKVIMIGGAALLVAVVAYLVIKKKHKGTPDISAPDSTLTYSGIWPLRRGSGSNATESALVKNLQRAINKLLPSPYSTIDVDGIFGPKTEQALLQVHSGNTINQVDYGKLLIKAQIS